MTHSRKVYPKNSFDRFGDDLMELIVSFLPIEDKFKFECLSRRTQSLIFNKQFVLRTKPNQNVFPRKAFGGFSYKKLKDVLTKLKFLTTIEFDGKVLINSQVIKFIVDLCPHLRHISIGKECFTSELSPLCIEYFGEKCGQNLKSFEVHQLVDKNVIKLLSCASNLVTLKVENLMDLTKNELKFPKLKNISFASKDGNLAEFQSHYSSTLRSITAVIDLRNIAPNNVNRLISGFGLMANLESIDMTIFNIISTKTIISALTRIAKDCNQLSDLSINICFDASLSTAEDHHLLKLCDFSHFTSLTSLSITVQKMYNVLNNQKFSFGSFGSLKTLTNLKCLTLDLSYLEDNTFESIGQCLPQLESIVIKPKTTLSDKTLQHLSKLRSLRSLELDFNRCRVTVIQALMMNAGSAASLPQTPKVTDSGIKQVLDNCRHLRRLRLSQFVTNCFDITFRTIEEFVSKARNNPKTRFYLSIDAQILNLNSDEISHSFNRMYDNLTVRFPLKSRLASIPYQTAQII